MERINALKITKQHLESKGIKVLTVSQVTLPEGNRTLQGLGLVVYHRPEELITDKRFLDYISGIVEERCLNVKMKGIIVDHPEGVIADCESIGTF